MTRRTIYTLAVDGFPTAITDLTFPAMRTWAKKLGADFHVITERRFPDWPVVCEKFQVGRLAKERKDEWAIFLDADALVHPDTPDLLEHANKATIYHHGLDVATTRYDTRDGYFRRDGRLVSPGNWLAIASEWCLDLWDFPPELTVPEVRARITQQLSEVQTGVRKENLFDDFLVARNIARFGLKADTLVNLFVQIRLNPVYFWHDYLHTNEEKVPMLRDALTKWGVTPATAAVADSVVPLKLISTPSFVTENTADA
jgi:hypothetical protein